MRKNKKILFFPFDLLSHYSRSIMLANSIKEQYEVQILYSEKYNDLYDALKISSFQCLSFDAEMILQHAKKFSFNWIQEDYLETIFLDQVRVIKELKPDLIIGDAIWTLKMAAEYCGVLYCSVINAYMSSYYKEVRGLPLNHPAYQYKEKLPGKVFDFITKTAEGWAFRKYHTPFRTIRKKRGLKTKRKLMEELDGDITLICDHQNLFPVKKTPSSFYNIGPLYYESDTSAEIEVQVVKRKTILICMGSSGDFQKLEILKDPILKGFIFIIITGKEDPGFGENFIVHKFLNLHKVLPLVDLMICHGGNGTIYYALKHKVPVLAMPSHFEQEWNMQQLIKFELGDIITEKESAVSIKNKIDYWIKQRNSSTNNFEIDLESSLKLFQHILDKQMDVINP